MRVSRLGTLAAVATAGLAVAGTTYGGLTDVQGCNIDTGTWYQNGLPGETNTVRVGFSESANGVLGRGTGTDAAGMPIERTAYCQEPAAEWRTFTSTLDDLDDTAELAVLPPDAQGGYAPIPATLGANVDGGEGNDEITGHPGPNKLDGGPGKDVLDGGSGKDRLNGRGGKDKLTGGPAKDKLSGGGGNDKLKAKDGVKDKVRCGKGKDRVKADGKDKVRKDCEKVV